MRRKLQDLGVSERSIDTGGKCPGITGDQGKLVCYPSKFAKNYCSTLFTVSAIKVYVQVKTSYLTCILMPTCKQLQFL